MPPKTQMTTAERLAYIIEQRGKDIPYYKIGAQLGLTRQRATQIHKEALAREATPPRTCWCGNEIPRSTREYTVRDGRPPEAIKYCSPDHGPHPTGLVTMGEYRAMVKAQNNLCAICQQPETSMVSDTVKQLAVDHDHKTGAARELLNISCNLLIGAADDNPELLENAADYLQAHPTSPKPCWCATADHVWSEHPRANGSCTTCGIHQDTSRKAKRCIDCNRHYMRLREQRDALAATQGDLCAICNTRETKRNKSGTTRELSLDHCHRSGTTRKLLCAACDNVLGKSNENQATLKAAAQYLRKHQAISLEKDS